MQQELSSIFKNNNQIDKLKIVEFKDNYDIMEESETLEEYIYFNSTSKEIETKKRRLLVTGIDGQIGYYVKKEFSDYMIFGLVKDKFESEKDIIKIKCNLEDRNELEKIILMIKPYAIIHLAGISCTQQCKLEPIRTININGLVTINICDIILKNKLDIRLFNSSSSEIYKGNKVYEIKSDDDNHKPTHPYSISKSMAHNMVDWYRKTFNLNFSNGVIFTTESIKRKSSFLVKKCLDHLYSVLEDKYEPLKLGNLDSYRCFIHANDVAKAIRIIIEQNQGDNYNICGNNILKLKNFILELYQYFGIHLIEKNSCFYYKDKILIEFESPELIDKRPDINVDKNAIIIGDNSKLKKLGWKIPDNINDFFEQLKIYI